MKNLRSKITIGIISALSLASCAGTEYISTEIHYNGDFLMYEARTGESIENLFKAEGGDINNEKEFRHFQEDIYNATGRIRGYDEMIWREGKLEIIEPSILFTPDLNKDKIPGQKEELPKRKRYTDA